MLIKPVTDKKYPQLEVHVCKAEMDKEVRDVCNELHRLFDGVLPGVDEKGDHCMLSIAAVFSFYAVGSKVYAKTAEKEYSVGKKLYELEEEYESIGFVRIAKSEIINCKKIRRLDMSLTGTIRLVMANGYETYASRRNVTKIKKLLTGEGVSV